MIIPDDFKTAIQATFNDKVITRYNSTLTKDVESFAYVEAGEDVDTFLGNVNFDNLEQIQEDYGIGTKIDISITTQASVENGTIISYLGYYYKLIKVFNYDSHSLLIGKEKKWSSRSTTLPSA